MHNSIGDLTAVSVCSNTRALIEAAYDSFRRFHPDVPMIIIDGSDPSDPCYSYVISLASEVTKVCVYGYNIGHGRGMHEGIKMVDTKFALIFDSDIVMLKSPVQTMLDMFEEDTYGVGYVEKTGLDGYEYGAKANHKREDYMYMMHPFFHMIQVKEYFKYHPYVHHGAPCFKAALDIHRKGLTSKIIKILPGLGHTHGKGWSWSSVPGEWVLHDTAGTRKDRVRKGKQEIEQNWER